jgi:conjugal transfer pilus assembly protein TraF
MASRFLIVLVLVMVSEAHAFRFSKRVCQEYGLGSNWYCEEEKEAEATPNTIMDQNVPPEQKAEMLNQLWEVQRKRAVITGEKKDLEQMLITQKYIAKLGTDFARKMMHLLETHPEHSQSESYYQNVSNEYIEEAKKEEVLKEARNRFAIVFVYSSTCPYCERQLPILHSLKEKIGISLIGVSVDGGRYEGLDQNIVDPYATSDPNIKAFPTIMLLDSKTEKRIFVSKGITTKDQLEKRIYNRIIEVENA